MPGKKSGGTGSDRGQGGFDKGTDKNIGTDRDVNAPKHGSENLDREDEESKDEPSGKPELPRE